MVSSSRWRMVSFSCKQSHGLFRVDVVSQHIAKAPDGADPRFANLFA